MEITNKQRVEHIEGHNQYVLPQSGDMRCDVVAFLSPALYEATEDAVWDQAVTAASYPGVTNVYLMPDCHSGFGVPIGAVVITDGTIIQCASGYDISCGVYAGELENIDLEKVADTKLREAWISEVTQRVATGIGSNRPPLMPLYTEEDLSTILFHGIWGADPQYFERINLPVRKEAYKVIPEAHEKALLQLGSLGGGNHFIELQVEPKSGRVFVMVHCGSRGYGWRTAEFFYRAGAELRGIPMNQRELSWLNPGEELYSWYTAMHNSAANYAIANRRVIALQLEIAAKKVFGEGIELCDIYDISHNLIQVEPDLAGYAHTVHRKGATRAFPSTHPWASRSTNGWTPCLIPGSMNTGAAILKPLSNAYRSGFSVNHGAGRVMSRGAARRALAEKQDVLDAELRETVLHCDNGVDIKGICSNLPQVPLDECGEVYKDLDAVLRVLKEEEIAEVTLRTYSVANIKGKD